MCDEPEELKRKVAELAAAVRSARHLVIYTGAGISTVGLGQQLEPLQEAVCVRAVAWFLNDLRMCMISLGCCTSPAASTVSRLHPGVIPATQEICGCIACIRVQDAQTEQEDPGLATVTWCKTLSQLARECYMCYQTCRDSC